jgi:hypothetical protein
MRLDSSGFLFRVYRSTKSGQGKVLGMAGRKRAVLGVLCHWPLIAFGYHENKERIGWDSGLLSASSER